jgi:hypothetical protein
MLNSITVADASRQSRRLIRRYVTLLTGACMCALQSLGAQGTTPEPPHGLWMSVSDSMVMRIEPCGAGFCGVGAGVPDGKLNDPKAPCGHRILHNFTWNFKSRRYEGTMAPPGMRRFIRSSVEHDAGSKLRVHARMMLISRTLEFVPFRGRLGDGCRIESVSP